MNVKINVLKAGANFACYATVTARGKKLHVTRDYPNGMEHAAREAAEQWCKDNGHKPTN